MSSVDQKETRLPLGVIVERRRSKHPWADWIWRPAAVFMTTDVPKSWVRTLQTEDVTQYHAATLNLELHRKETPGMVENLRHAPVVYVILTKTTERDAEFPYLVHQVTASPHDAEAYLGWEETIVGKVAMPEPVAAFVEAFISVHHVDEPFKKRRRNRLNVEEQKFSKSAIFTPLTKQ